jgi:hypothetical protein
MPLLEELVNEAIKDRHWTDIFALLGATYDPEAPFSIKVSFLSDARSCWVTLRCSWVTLSAWWVTFTGHDRNQRDGRHGEDPGHLRQRQQGVFAREGAGEDGGRLGRGAVPLQRVQGHGWVLHRINPLLT